MGYGTWNVPTTFVETLRRRRDFATKPFVFPIAFVFFTRYYLYICRFLSHTEFA